MDFVYDYRYSVDEELSQQYQLCRVKYAVVVRTNFKVIDVNGAARIIGSEMYSRQSLDEYDCDFLSDCLTERIRSYFIPDGKAEELIDGALNFADELIAGGSQDRVTVVVLDLDVCTVQKNGEGIAETEDRAMKLEHLPPLHIYRVYYEINPEYPRPENFEFTAKYLTLELFLLDLANAAMSLYSEKDVEKALAEMEACVVCGRRPMVGTRISTLRCGHAFHCHCIVRSLEKDINCPICHHPARDEPVSRGPCIFLDDYDDDYPGDDGTLDDDCSLDYDSYVRSRL